MTTKINKLCYFIALILLMAAAGCKKKPITDEPIPKPEEKKDLAAADSMDVSYGSNEKNKLDIYLPLNRTKDTKVILIIHGGSWYQGDKTDDSLAFFAKHFRGEGYACANINYRLTHTPENNIHPAQVNDIAQAIAFISSKATVWNISADKFALIGYSSGGHLALLNAYNYNSSKKVKTVVSIAGPTNLPDERNVKPESYMIGEWFIGESLAANLTKYQQASPITHASKAVPTLIFHGKQDDVVPVQQSLDLESELIKFGVNRKLVQYEDTGHTTITEKNILGFMAECDSWLKANLQ